METVAFGPSDFSKLRNPADRIKENEIKIDSGGSVYLGAVGWTYPGHFNHPYHYPGSIPPRLNCKSIPLSGGVIFLCFHNAARPGYNMMSLQHNSDLHGEASSLSMLIMTVAVEVV